jgi:PAS domain S-box-containing protein
MKLRTRTALVVGLVLVACTAVTLLLAYSLLAVGIRSTTSRALATLESSREADLASARDAFVAGLKADQETFVARAVALARRDDTYAHVETRNAAWRRTNLPDSLCPDLRLSAVLLVAAGGRVVDRLSYDLDRRTYGDPPAGLLAAVAPGERLVSAQDPAAVLSGLILLPEGPMLVAACPVTPRTGAGPIRGTLVLGRFLTTSELAEMGARIGASVELFRVDAPDLPSDVKAAGAVSVPLSDAYGSPALVARIALRGPGTGPATEALRSVARQASAAGVWLAILLAGSALIVFGTVLLANESALYRRTTALTARLGEIAAAPAADARVEAHGDDELALLENSVNEALAAVEKEGRLAAEREKSLAAAVERARLALQAAGQLVYDVDVGAGRISFDGAVSRVTGYTLEELRTMPLSAWEAMVHPEDRAAAVAATEQAASSGAAYRIEYRLQRKDGSYASVEDRGARVPGDTPRIIGTMRAVAHRPPAPPQA